MKRMAIALPIVLAAAADAAAISRHNIDGMSCAKVKGIIQSEGGDTHQRADRRQLLLSAAQMHRKRDLRSALRRAG